MATGEDSSIGDMGRSACIGGTEDDTDGIGEEDRACGVG